MTCLRPRGKPGRRTTGPARSLIARQLLSLDELGLGQYTFMHQFFTLITMMDARLSGNHSFVLISAVKAWRLENVISAMVVTGPSYVPLMQLSYQDN